MAGKKDDVEMIEKHWLLVNLHKLETRLLVKMPIDHFF